MASSTQSDQVNPAVEFIEWMHQSLAHYSNKVVNSNAGPGGVRLAREQALGLPHLCGRTLLSERLNMPSETERLELDYTVVNPRFKFLRHCLGEEVSNLSDKFDFTAQAKSEFSSLYQKMADGEAPALLEEKAEVSSRLKQLLVPRDHDHVSLTPLPCLPVGMHLKKAFQDREGRFYALSKKLNAKKTTREEKEAALQELKELGRLSTLSSYPVGGANPQNTGARIHEAFTRPIVCADLPKTNPEVRKAFAIAHNGIRFRLPRALVEKYDQVLSELCAGSGASRPTWTRANREKETVTLRALFQSWERQAEAARRLVEEHENSLPAPLPCLELESGKLLEGWLYPEKRTYQWREDVVKGFVRQLRDFVLRRDDHHYPVTLGLTPEDERRIRASLAEGTWL